LNDYVKNKPVNASESPYKPPFNVFGTFILKIFKTGLQAILAAKFKK
jgi:hypothetical protein